MPAFPPRQVRTLEVQLRQMRLVTLFQLLPYARDLLTDPLDWPGYSSLPSVGRAMFNQAVAIIRRQRLGSDAITVMLGGETAYVIRLGEAMPRPGPLPGSAGEMDLNIVVPIEDFDVGLIVQRPDCKACSVTAH